MSYVSPRLIKREFLRALTETIKLIQFKLVRQLIILITVSAEDKLDGRAVTR